MPRLRAAVIFCAAGLAACGDYSSGWDEYPPLSPPTTPPASPPAPPLTCHPHGGEGCTSVYVNTNYSVCVSESITTCEESRIDEDSDEPKTGFSWGIAASLIADVIISFGLAMQKEAHNRALQKCKELGDGSEPNPFKQPVWVLGLAMVIGGEVGNFAAYGDPSTPASVVTAVGCVGVIANLFIATFFLKEPFRRRDLVGVLLVVTGVLLLVFFAPKQDSVLDADRFYDLMSQPSAYVTLSLVLIAIIVLFFLCPKHGHKHVLWNLSQASLIGCLTVVASKAISTFLNLTLKAIFDPNVPMNDQVNLNYDEPECNASGYHWGQLNETCPCTYGCITVRPWYKAVNDSSGNIVIDGKSQLDQWAMWVALIVMVVTAVAQVKYINKGMALFGNSEVIPVHYVTFTLFSIVVVSIVYQEFSVANDGVCPQYIYLHLFIDGCILTFLGVWLITSNRLPAEDFLKDETPLLNEDDSAEQVGGAGGAEGGSCRSSQLDVRGSAAARLSTAPNSSKSTSSAALPLGAANMPIPEEFSVKQPALHGAPAGAPLHPAPLHPEEDGEGAAHLAGRKNSISGVLRERGISMERAQASLDARGTRQSRSGSVLSYLGAMAGGVSTVLYDPQDHFQQSDGVYKPMTFEARTVSITRRASTSAPLPASIAAQGGSRKSYTRAPSLDKSGISFTQEQHSGVV